MFTFNKVKIYTSPTKKTSKSYTTHNNKQFEELGNKHSTICCLISSTSKIKLCKDYKFLINIFEKMHIPIKSIYTINIQNSTDCSFVYLKSEFEFTKMYFFGENTVLSTLPTKLEKLIQTNVEGIDMLLVDNLLELSKIEDKNYKARVWDVIKSFQKKIS